MTLDSLELLRRMEAGHADALEQLLERNLPALRCFVRLRCGPEIRAKEESSDLVQSVCREVLSNLDRFQYPSENGFQQWLFLTAARKIKNRYAYYLAAKRDARRERRSSASESADAFAGCYASVCTPSREVAANEQIAEIEAAFDKLPEHYREVILLSRVVKLSSEEIAARMDKTEGAVRVLLCRALARLAERLAPN
ncbi:MAG: sigma-70 family RNA polymerase sigma factor [Planctomycetota bacterium]